MSDAPVHTVQRSLITKAFSARVMDRMRERIQSRVDSLIDAMQQKGNCDFVSDFAYPLPSLVIFDLLGVPEQHYLVLRRSAEAVTRFTPAILTKDVNTISHIAKALLETEAVLRNLLTQRRAAPKSDLISTLASVREEQSELSDDDIVVLCNILLFAGHETTLRSSPALLGNAIEELLRFVSPVLTVPRVAAEDVELHQTTV